MNYIMQTKRGKEDGNCLAACVATIFNCNINEVPVLPNGMKTWVQVLSEWMLSRFNKYCVLATFSEQWHLTLMCGSLNIVVVDFVVGGEVWQHAVICKDGRIVFCPVEGKVDVELVSSMNPVYILFCDFKDA